MARGDLYIDNRVFTDEVVKFNNKSKPILIYNKCFDTYVENYNIKPVWCEGWDNVVELYREYEYKKINKSINRHNNNSKSNQDKDVVKLDKDRKEEIDGIIYKIKEIDPSSGKIKPLEYPLTVWNGVWKIINHYSTNYKFFKYHNREDMIMSAMEKCLRYMSNFSLISSNNAVSYFTTITHYAFLETINREYEQNNIKAKLNQDYYSDDIDTQTSKQSEGAD